METAIIGYTRESGCVVCISSDETLAEKMFLEQLYRAHQLVKPETRIRCLSAFFQDDLLVELQFIIPPLYLLKFDLTKDLPFQLHNYFEEFSDVAHA